MSPQGRPLKTRSDMKLAYKLLCIVSVVIALVVLLVSSVYLALLDAPKSVCGNTKEHYTLAKAASSLGIIGSILQVVWAILLIIVWMGDTTKYFIGHLFFGAVTLVATILVCIHGGVIDCTKCEAFLAFLILDSAFCFISAIVLCVLK
ncbi:unnamed protein product [Allacma fusca]|uniref:MARVEL domain-containing protein n=1 Tax=Allacma fusca TaxID=39272 RepID=A0A8J2NL82_9HEXA|nr:unnamed protein product [Allacma fusca]